MMERITMKIFLIAAIICVCPTFAGANNLSVTNVSLGSRDPGAKTVVVSFDASWDNSWHNKINHDALWLTVRLQDATASPVAKKLCQISAAGINPAGSSVGTAKNLEFYVPSDKQGAFLRRSANGPVLDVSTQNAQLTINYNSCGFSDSDQIYASVFALEMVFVPQGSFYAGDYNASAASLNKGSADSSPWNIISENAISAANPASGGYRYVSGGNAGEYATGASVTVPANFPKGYNSFYVMKYEINEGQWVEFLNSLPSAAARANRDLTDNNHKNADSVVDRNAITCVGTPLLCATDRPGRAASFLSWMDLAAFLDWSALRPITDLEFEKISRGPTLPVQGEYVWGTTDITAADTLNGTEDGSEGVSTVDANAHYGNTTLSGGDASSGAGYVKGALRGGIFATSTSNRISAGAGYYGVMDLAGNLKERIVTIGNSAGVAFTGTHGDGVLSTAVGFEGNANTLAWPGLDADVSHGVTGANGSGFRGGSWADAASYLRISDRTEAALSSGAALSTFGGRGARTYDGN